MLDTDNTKNSGELLEKKMQVNGREGQKLTRKKSLAVSVVCMAIYRRTPGFKGRTFDLCVFSTDGTVVSVSAFPHCGYCFETEERQTDQERLD